MEKAKDDQRLRDDDLEIFYKLCYFGMLVSGFILPVNDEAAQIIRHSFSLRLRFRRLEEIPREEIHPTYALDH